MPQQILNMRVRPARVAVLVANNAAREDFGHVVRFLSQLWGGRFSPILTVEPEEPDSLTVFRLKNLRPDFVFGRKINDGKWAAVVQQACQPRQYAPLADSLAEDIRSARHEMFIHADAAVIAMFRARHMQSQSNRPLKVVTAGTKQFFSQYCDAMFGVHHPDLRDEYRDEHVSFTSSDTTEFVDLCKEFVEEWKLSWLDATAQGLDVVNFVRSPLPPTIVLVRNPVSDLSLF